ncbi:MAG TPA: hypothetical protein VK658_16630 [Chryseolinea sp.]|nr:hypothetical protein [Chryseolinea sp.]
MISGATTSVRIYNSIKDACMSMTGTSTVKQFALWNNQIDKVKSGDHNPIMFPFVGVTFENEFNQLSVGRQEINGIFVLYLCVESLKHKDEDILTFKDSLYAHLASELPKLGFGDFYRTFEVIDTDHDNVLVWQMEFSYSYIDDSAKDKGRKIHPYDVGYDVHY